MGNRAWPGMAAVAVALAAVTVLALTERRSRDRRAPRVDEPLLEPLALDAARCGAGDAQDAYKLLHQAALGTEHAIRDAEGPRAWLARELAALPAAPGDAALPLVDTIAPGGRVVRVHLRPWRARGGDPESLLAAFVASANTPPGSRDTLADWLARAGRLARERRIPVDARDLARLADSLGALGWPAVHHSPAYEAACTPAYRVIVRDHLSRALRGVR